MYCVIKRIVQGNQVLVKNADFHSCNVKTQICITHPQCVKKCCISNAVDKTDDMLWNGGEEDGDVRS